MENETEDVKPIETTALFCVGDAVTWTHTTSSGGGFNFSTRNGKIEEIGGFSASVKMRNGRKAWVLLSRLRKEGQRTELTEAFMGKESPQNDRGLATARCGPDQLETLSPSPAPTCSPS